MTAAVTLTREDDHVAILTLDDAAHQNTFTEEVVDAFLELLPKVSTDPTVRVLLLRGREDVFCAGAPQELLLELADGDLEPADILLSKALLDVRIPVIAALEGHAVGGGLALALCADIVLMARESRYGCSFMNLGFTPGMGTTRLLADAVGEYIAKEMMFGGQMFKGAHFAERSNINYVLRRGRVWHKARQIAGRIAEKPRHALEALKADLSVRPRQRFEESRTREAHMHKLCFGHPETRALIEENYADTRPKADD